MKQKNNFEKALNKLIQFASLKSYSEVEKAGVIQAFEYTFEQTWKLFQKMAYEQGVLVNSPKSSLQAALQLSYITVAEELIWANMLRDRNLTIHTYHEDLAEEIFINIIEKYLPALIQVQKKL